MHAHKPALRARPFYVVDDGWRSHAWQKVSEISFKLPIEVGELLDLRSRVLFYSDLPPSHEHYDTHTQADLAQVGSTGGRMLPFVARCACASSFMWIQLLVAYSHTRA
eukprot:scaffold1419_cov410-Prasinococcus_capsulatus_cf.AAC.19